METVAEWSWRTYPAPLGAGGVGSIPANPDAQNVPSFRRRRFEMKLSPFLLYTDIYYNIHSIYRYIPCIYHVQIHTSGD